jgi:diacylglycerol kinase
VILRDQPSRPSGHYARWRRRFADAFHGLSVATREQESLWVHFAFAFAVVVLSAMLLADWWRWCLIVLCIVVVISLELVNSAIERLVKTLHPEHDSGLAEALHMAAAAVLVAAIGSTVVGLIVFVPPIVQLFN